MDSEVGQIMIELQKNKLSLLRYFEKHFSKLSGGSVLKRIIISEKIKDYLTLVSIAPLIVLIVNFFI